MFQHSRWRVAHREYVCCRAKHRARQFCSAKVSGTNLREGRRDEFLVAASRRAFDQNSTRRAINELVSRRHLVASRSVIDDALRRVRSDRWSDNDISIFILFTILFFYVYAGLLVQFNKTIHAQACHIFHIKKLTLTIYKFWQLSVPVLRFVTVSCSFIFFIVSTSMLIARRPHNGCTWRTCVWFSCTKSNGTKSESEWLPRRLSSPRYWAREQFASARTCAYRPKENIFRDILDRWIFLRAWDETRFINISTTKTPLLTPP